mmetsp:Transcript_36482/g.86068  ORF Transcript_36482/g.86068 Transcript_36482/m.86068 type:complete len:233 (-) Transcript_36482:125-823(-)
MMPLHAPRRARRQSPATPVITHIVDVVFERDVLRDEDLITDARLKLFEIALETRAVVVGRDQGAQGARPEPVVDGELPLCHDEIRVEFVVHTGTMPEVVPSFVQLGIGQVAPDSPRAPGLVDHRIHRTIVEDFVPIVLRDPPLHEAAHPPLAGERREHQAIHVMAKEDLVISLERDTFHNVVQRAVFDVRAGAVEANHLPPLGLEREVRALEGRLRRGRGGRRGRWRLGRRR